ncbi:phosphatidate cytidylyltransferase [Natronospira proteinivora]|uniref:Phosphatidate cytidylyltransferase n=1 Tax=Natronospira proteinivora TaxID=1807133 RepID=A0ABT1G9K2_9GAMM|nr:phosphatidate cytidylyltransferase [Natronospira proteinivora]MCP1726622.1 phosphatidate cytidylyltransferase [Natronospira proteinivora]
MLKQRVITALIVGPLALAGVFLLPSFWFGLALAGAMAIAAQEWAGLASPGRRGVMAAFVPLVFLSCLLFLWLDLELAWGAYPLWAVVPLWVLALMWLARPEARPPVLAKLGFGLFALSGAWLGLYLLQGQSAGPWLLILLFGLVWGADVGAYFAGKAFGCHKLAPRVSPGKTWEGVAGGLALSGLVAVVAVPLLGIEQMVSFVLLCLVAAAISVAGDLVESLLKRQAGIKDSGWLLPGHGGVLDRMDSLLVAAPILVLGLSLMGELS